MSKYALHRMQMQMISSIARSILGGQNVDRSDLLRGCSDSRSTKWRYLKSLEELEREGFIIISGEKIGLSERGLEVARKSQIFNINIKKNKKWDGIWHVATYDIPESFKVERNIFQRKLKSIGLYQLQKSLWVYPYKCEEEIGLLANELALSNFVAFLRTENVPFKHKVKKHFGV